MVYALAAGKPERRRRRLDLALPAEAYREVERSGVPIRREFALAPGRYQARLLLKDRASGLMGSVRHEFEVAPVQPLQVTTPILTGFLPGRREAGQRRPIPVAHRTFAAGATIACAFSILGAAPDPVRSGPRVSVAYRLRRADGGDVMASPARVLSAGPLGQVTPVIFLKRAGCRGGFTEVDLTIHDEVATTTLEVVEPFTVVRP